jgi:GxxExxY protein
MDMKHKDLTAKVIRSYYKVYNSLGFGFLEKVYQNAMFFELLDQGLNVEAQKKISVKYKERIVGDFYADILVNDTIIVELKATSALTEAHEAQVLNYLKATNIEVGLLFNFGIEPEFTRKIWDNTKKARNQEPNEPI